MEKASATKRSIAKRASEQIRAYVGKSRIERDANEEIRALIREHDEPFSCALPRACNISGAHPRNGSCTRSQGRRAKYTKPRLQSEANVGPIQVIRRLLQKVWNCGLCALPAGSWAAMKRNFWTKPLAPSPPPLTRAPRRDGKRDRHEQNCGPRQARKESGALR